jgi:hypothetical protein
VVEVVGGTIEFDPGLELDVTELARGSVWSGDEL